MCGIAGILRRDKDAAREAARAMNAAQTHRGPDDEGIESFATRNGTLALGHRRLSIVDLSPAGHMPMQNPGTGDWIVFCGEIYNFLELRAELEGMGDAFRSRTDTEVILKAYERWGEACFEKLCGMFALAIYSSARKELVLARDPLGIKPLYYCWKRDEFAFASETRALVRAGVAAADIDRRALAGMIAYGAVQEPLTIYAGVKALEPGTWAALDLSGKSKGTFARHGRHWEFPEAGTKDGAAALEELRAALSNAARSHLIADVPAGVFLSSGIDSTAVAALCAQSRGGLDAFTVQLSDRPDLDESAPAARSAKELGLRHHLLSLSEAAVRNQTREWIAAQDQPSMDGLNTYVISKAVREQGMIVALSGLGGDELFGGYPSFRDVPKMVRWMRRARVMPAAMRRLGTLTAFYGKSTAQKQKAADTATTAPTIPAMYFRRRRLTGDEDMKRLGFDAQALNLTAEFLPPECEPERGLPRNDAAAAIAILETRFFMRNTLLRDSDVCGMAHGLEIRVPLLDRRVLDCAFALSGAARVPAGGGGPNKPVLINALGELLPKHVLQFNKRGFSLSQAEWMRGPLRDFFESANAVLKKSNRIDANVAAGIWTRFLRSGQGPDWACPWTLGVLGSWMDTAKSA